MFINYESMWNELRAKMEELQEKKDSIDIEVLIAVMNQIEYFEEMGYLEEFNKKAMSLKVKC